MKKLTKILLLAVVLVLSLVLATACETLENHEHKAASTWTFDGKRIVNTYNFAQ